MGEYGAGYEHMQLKDMANVGELQKENTKLRELVKRMRRRIDSKCLCCSIFCSDWDKENDCCVFTTLECELGIEVET